MHAFLIVGNNEEARQEEIKKRCAAWKISSWDIIRIPLDEHAVGIEKIRDFQHHLSLAPRNSPAKVGVIDAINTLTIEAQNALLKTLEEPPPATYILAQTENPNTLLPTILSRFTLIHMGETNKQNELPQTFLSDVLDAPPAKRLQMLDTYTTDRDTAKNFVSAALIQARSMLYQGKNVTALIRSLLTAEQMLSVNVNPKLVVDNAVLNNLDIKL